jgi:hypothetical protein
MGTTLTGTEIKDTYDSLIKVTDNGPISGTLKALSDGLGNDSTLSLSTAAASIAGTLAVTGAATLSSTLSVGADTTLSGASGDRTLKIQTNTTGNPILNFTAAGDNAGTIDVRGSSIIRSTMGIKTERTGIVTGNVGIGTSSPASKFHVSDAWMTLQRTSGTTNILDFTDSAAARIGYVGAISSNISILSTQCKLRRSDAHHLCG